MENLSIRLVETYHLDNSDCVIEEHEMQDGQRRLYVYNAGNLVRVHNLA